MSLFSKVFVLPSMGVYPLVSFMNIKFNIHVKKTMDDFILLKKSRFRVIFICLEHNFCCFCLVLLIRSELVYCGLLLFSFYFFLKGFHLPFEYTSKMLPLPEINSIVSSLFWYLVIGSSILIFLISGCSYKKCKVKDTSS